MRAETDNETEAETGSPRVGPVRRAIRRRKRRWARRILQPQAKGRVLHEPNPEHPNVLPEFRFFAVLGTWMEEDVVEATVRNAFAQGVEAVYVVDNASTDATVERAVAAGATFVESFHTRLYEERIRILLMNAVVARMSLASGADHVWWLWLDADEFPEGPSGMTLVEYLHTLDRQIPPRGEHVLQPLPHREARVHPRLPPDRLPTPVRALHLEARPPLPPAALEAPLAAVRQCRPVRPRRWRLSHRHPPHP